MARVFLIVLDSVGIGGAPDADQYFNGEIPDTGSNTVAHIAQAVGGLHLPHLDALGLGAAVALSSGADAPGLGTTPQGRWGAATETSRGKDTPSGHWDLAGVPVPWDWHYFPDADPAFPLDVSQAVATAAGTAGILGDCHASGTEIIERLGHAHLRTGWPICYTSVDSVFQIAAHDAVFDLARLHALCAAVAPRLHAMNVGRVIARPFTGSPETGFHRMSGRRDFAIAPPAPTLCDWVHDAGRCVHAVGKVGDIFSMRGIDDVVKGTDEALLRAITDLIGTAEEGSLTFANLVEFDSDYGHRRDPQGYAEALRRFDDWLGVAMTRLRLGDMLLITADHGNDPTWAGTDHTRERVPVLIAGCGTGALGQVLMADVAASVAMHLGVPSHGQGRSFL
ncbi:phosphopentomutase [Pseudohalocynthiibacter aestuariivivens]|nr:phosphopentomutase [Pseudohalocynthiibacter aestuariivivens]QIE45137.1 phosphopentomutase [Pseudohalocynthiibacter aestuariivivens]